MRIRNEAAQNQAAEIASESNQLTSLENIEVEALR